MTLQAGQFSLACHGREATTHSPLQCRIFTRAWLFPNRAEGQSNNRVTFAAFRLRLCGFNASRALIRNPDRRWGLKMVEDDIRNSTMAIEIPVNGKTLAAQLGRSPGYIAAMKSAGYNFSHGTRTLVSDALKWLAAHPDFRATGYRRNLPGFVKRQRPQP